MKCSETIQKLVIDQSAETVKELIAATCMSDFAMRRVIAENMKSGRWEQVRKRQGCKMVPAYRVKKK